MWTSYNVTENKPCNPNIDCNTFKNNNEAKYGKKIGSLPSELLLEDPQVLNPCKPAKLGKNGDCELSEFSKAEFDAMWKILATAMTPEERKPLDEIIAPKKEEKEEAAAVSTPSEPAAPAPNMVYAEASPAFIKQRKAEEDRL